MYSQLLKHHKIPPHDRKSYQVAEKVLTEGKFIYGITLECIGRLLCRVERSIREVLTRYFSFATSETSRLQGTHKIDTRIRTNFAAYYMSNSKAGSPLKLVLQKIVDRSGPNMIWFRSRAASVDLSSPGDSKGDI